jgi:hypothetical protein
VRPAPILAAIAWRPRLLYVPDMRRPALFRACAILWAVLQFALPAGATYADARLERDGRDATQAHVESSSGDSCRAPHADDCAICQVVSRSGVAPHSVDLPDIAVVVHPSAPGTASGEATRACARASLPRAPPAALA